MINVQQKIFNPTPEKVEIQFCSRPFVFEPLKEVSVPYFEFNQKDKNGHLHGFQMNIDDIPGKICKEYGGKGLFVFEEYGEEFEKKKLRALRKYLENTLKPRIKYFENFKEMHEKAKKTVEEPILVKKSRKWAKDIQDILNLREEEEGQDLNFFEHEKKPKKQSKKRQEEDLVSKYEYTVDDQG